MSRRRRKAGDLVLSMTLAEIFLLLLFLVWLGDVAARSGGLPVDPTALKIENDRLKAENGQLSDEVRRLKADLDQLRLIVDAFRKTLGISEPITSPEQVPGAVQQAADAARRGAPRCAADNLFARVLVRDGEITLTVVAPAQVVADVAAVTRTSFRTGQALTSTDDIETVLRAVASYAGVKSCRFDYALTYATKADYYDGRQRFERGRLFYAAGVASEATTPR